MDYNEKLKEEMQRPLGLIPRSPNFQVDHFLNSKLFYSNKRQLFCYTFLKQQMFRFIDQVVDKDKPSVLVAPIGDGDDIRYLLPISNDISGIDLSEKAINEISDSRIKKYVGDIKNMNMFSDNHFDVIVSPLFFHHYVEFGFDDFLKEIYRVLKPGGYFFSLEPSSLCPISWTTRLIRKSLGNITGLIEDEKPVSPFRLSGAMKRCGMRDVKVFGASFSHNRFPTPLAKIINISTIPFLRFPIIKYFAWMCLFCGKK